MIIENSLCVNINIEVRIQEDELGKDKDGVEVRTDGKARCILEFNRFILWTWYVCIDSKNRCVWILTRILIGI